jgi:hypothetical protein
LVVKKVGSTAPGRTVAGIFVEFAVDGPIEGVGGVELESLGFVIVVVRHAPVPRLLGRHEHRLLLGILCLVWQERVVNDGAKRSA